MKDNVRNALLGILILMVAYGIVAVTREPADDLEVRGYQIRTIGGVSSGVTLPITGTTIITTTEDIPVTLDGEAVTVSDITTGTVSVEQSTHDSLNVNANAQVGNADVSASNPMLAAPFQAMVETGAVELIGVDEQASQYDWSDGTEIALGGTYSGEILNVTLILSGSLSEAGTLVVFDADPSVTLADANLATASWLLAIGKNDVAAGDWFEENSGGTGAVAHFATPIAFHGVSSLWVAYYHEGATQWNSLAADNETLDIQIEYRRDS